MSADKAGWWLVQAALCRWWCYCMADQLWQPIEDAHDDNNVASFRSSVVKYFANEDFHFLLSAIVKNVNHPTTVLRPFFRDHPGEPVPEENFWTLWCKGRLTEADTLTIQLGATPSGLISAHLHHPPIFLQAGCPCCRPTNSVKALKAKVKNVKWYRFALVPYHSTLWRRNMGSFYFHKFVAVFW